MSISPRMRLIGALLWCALLIAAPVLGWHPDFWQALIPAIVLVWFALFVYVYTSMASDRVLVRWVCVAILYLVAWLLCLPGIYPTSSAYFHLGFWWTTALVLSNLAVQSKLKEHRRRQ